MEDDVVELADLRELEALEGEEAVFFQNIVAERARVEQSLAAAFSRGSRNGPYRSADAGSIYKPFYDGLGRCAHALEITETLRGKLYKELLEFEDVLSGYNLLIIVAVSASNFHLLFMGADKDETDNPSCK